MKKALFRLCALAITVLMLVSLCACGGDATTTTTAGGDATTTLADEVTTTVADGETTTVADDVTTTVGDEDPTTVGGNDQPTNKPTNKPTTDKKDDTTTGTDPWGKGTKPKKTTTTTATDKVSYATLAKVERDPKYQNEHGIYNLFKYYCWNKVFKPSELTPAFGYVKDGKVVDVMFEGCSVMPSPNNVYHGDLNTKESWDEWREHSYANVDSINETVASIQKTLNLKEYKVKVFLSLFNPNHEGGADRWKNFGELNGVKMTAKNKEERFQMMKYMIDSYVAEMKTQSYTNVEFAGFYWFDEYVTAGDMDWYKRVTDYIHSKGLLVMISPFYKASGWDLCTEAGFDLTSMQSNYFPSWEVGALNCGTIRRIQGLSDAINSGKIGGAEIEITTTSVKDDITGFKHILKGLAENGIMNGYELFYFGPTPLYTLSRERDPYYRSAYDDLYKYVHNKLVPSEMEIHEFEEEQKFMDGATDWI